MEVKLDNKEWNKMSKFEWCLLVIFRTQINKALPSKTGSKSKGMLVQILSEAYLFFISNLCCLLDLFKCMDHKKKVSNKK